MSRLKSQASVTDRLHQLRIIFADLRDSLTGAESSGSPDTLRAALVVTARAINLFVGNYSISEHMADTQLVQLNSRMIRLTSQASDLSDTYVVACSMLDSISRDIDIFASSFQDETDNRRLSSKVVVDESEDQDTDDLCDETEDN